jgi:hypothetical protein
MGRSAIISKDIVTTKVIYTAKFVSYVIPVDDRIGVFHSLETVNKTAVVKFFPAQDPLAVFKITPGGAISFS